MILYKVVTKGNRTSTMNLFMIRYNKRYSKEYEIGKVVKAEPDTLGIFCFTSELSAMKWIKEARIYFEQYEILEVKPLTKPKRKIPRICKRLTEERMNYFYSNLLNKSEDKYCLNTIDAPSDTVCVKRVEVLT